MDTAVAMAIFGDDHHHYQREHTMSNAPVYEANVYTRTVTYKNFKGELNEAELYFTLDPLTLMQIISSFEVKPVKSGNPAREGKLEISDEKQLKFIQDLASRAAGVASDDGESWTHFEKFEETLAGRAFLTQLTASDGDRKEFAERVVLDPFRAFVSFAKADPSNSPKDKQNFDTMLAQMENIFKVPEASTETLAEKKARLAAEMAALESPAGTTGQVGLGE